VEYDNTRPQYYEDIIQNSPLFTIDARTSPSRYAHERINLLEALYCYVRVREWQKSNERDRDLELYGLKYGNELFKVANACIAAYDPSVGAFLPYFKKAWASEMRHIQSREGLEKRNVGLMKSTVDEKRLAVKYLQFCAAREKRQINLSSDKTISEFSQAFGIPLEKVKQIAQLGIESVVSPDQSDENGEESEKWLEQFPSDDSTEEVFEQKEEISQAIDRLNMVYRSLQERQRPIISDLLTVNFWLSFYETGQAKKALFFSEEIITEYRKNRRLPTQKEIGEKYGRSEASVSRTYAEFMNKVRQQQE